MTISENTPHGLVGLPSAFDLESPSSWLTRAALSQGETTAALLVHMGLPNTGDVDVLLTSDLGQRAIRACDLMENFEVARTIFGRLRLLGSLGEQLLLRTRAGQSRYRFCPLCFRSQRIAHLEIQCRLSTWRFCPRHNCFMEDSCPHCGNHVVLPNDMVNAGRRGSGIAYLRQCQFCGKPLNAGQAVSINAVPLSNWGRMLMTNGRASVSTLFFGFMRLDVTDRRRKPLQQLQLLANMGLLPLNPEWLTADKAREFCKGLDSEEFQTDRDFRFKELTQHNTFLETSAIDRHSGLDFDSDHS